MFLDHLIKISSHIFVLDNASYFILLLLLDLLNNNVFLAFPHEALVFPVFGIRIEEVILDYGSSLNLVVIKIIYFALALLLIVIWVSVDFHE